MENDRNYTTNNNNNNTHSVPAFSVNGEIDFVVVVEFLFSSLCVNACTETATTATIGYWMN